MLAQVSEQLSASRRAQYINPKTVQTLFLDQVSGLVILGLGSQPGADKFHRVVDSFPEFGGPQRDVSREAEEIGDMLRNRGGRSSKRQTGQSLAKIPFILCKSTGVRVFGVFRPRQPNPIDTVLQPLHLPIET